MLFTISLYQHQSWADITLYAIRIYFPIYDAELLLAVFHLGCSQLQLASLQGQDSKVPSPRRLLSPTILSVSSLSYHPLSLFSTPTRLPKTHLPLIPPVIGCSQFCLNNSFKSRNKVCTTKICKCENSLGGLDLQVQNLALQYITTDQTSTVDMQYDMTLQCL